ncbi:MAG: prolipoprotein diacylglyceryl transferase [Lachnospiraceae bacterium]|nr:prolipoprotein diacylglyceryl transferase [Lachnospiraceae bacterium]
MKNELFSIGPFTFYGYGLMMALGIISAYWMVDYRARKKGISDSDHVFYMALTGVVCGLLGAKILYLFTRLQDLIEDPSIFMDCLKDGFVVYGSIIGGVLGAYIYCRNKKMPFLKLFDLTAPAFALAQGIGRIGCFLAGCCYGMEVSNSCPIAVTFTNSAYAPNNVPLLPTQLISSLLNLLHFAVLMILSKKLKKDGQIAGCFLTFYSIGRFVLEYFRGDLIRGNVGSFTTSQFISLFICLFGLFMIFVLPRFQKEVETEEENQN